MMENKASWSIVYAGTNNELLHYGRKGMKWGQHIYDDSATSSEHTQESLKKQDSKSSAKIRLQNEKQQIRQLREKNKQLRSNNRMVSREYKNAVKNVRSMSDQELNSRINRLNREKQLQDLTLNQVTPGKKFISGILKNSGRTVLASVATGAMYYAVNAALDGSGNPELKGYIKRKK